MPGIYDGNNWRSDPASGAFDITPSDTVDLTRPAKALFVKTAGDVKITTTAGDTVTWPFAASSFVPLAVRRVFATGTTATVGGLD